MDAMITLQVKGGGGAAFSIGWLSAAPIKLYCWSDDNEIIMGIVDLGT